MGYYFKQSFVSFGYLVFMSLSAIGFLMIGNDLLWLKYLLCGLGIVLYCLVVGVVSFKDGETAYKVMLANDLERKQIILTGEDRPLKEKEEYRAWKGFLFGLIASSPAIILMIIHAILTAINPVWVGAGSIASILFMMVFSFVLVGKDLVTGVTSTLPASQFYLCLLAVPVAVLTTGLCYMLGAKRAELRQRMVEKKHKEIYGEDAR